MTTPSTVSARNNSGSASDSSTTHRRLGIRSGTLRRDIVAPESMTLNDMLQWIGITRTSTHRILRERSGEVLDPGMMLAQLSDGDVVTVVDPRADVSQRDNRTARNRTAQDRGTEHPESVAPWWFMGVAGVLLTLSFALIPATRPNGAWLWLPAFAAIFAVVTAIILVRRRRSAHLIVGTRILGGAAVVAAAAVLVSPPGEFTFAVTTMTVLASLAVFFAVIAVVARNAVVRAQLNSFAGVTVGVFIVHALVLVMGLRESIVYAVIVGAIPLVLRALPTTMLHVPAGLFIDFEKHQQSRWTVREAIPEPYTHIDVDRVQQLVDKGLARFRIVTGSVCALVVLFWPLVIWELWSAPTLEFIGSIVLAVCLVIALALSSRRFDARILKWMLRATALFILVTSVMVLVQGSAADTRAIFAIGWLIVGVIVACAIILYARGARSVFWSRFGDIVEAIAVVFTLPAALVAAGIIDTVRGAMS